MTMTTTEEYQTWADPLMSDNIKTYYHWYHKALAIMATAHLHLTPEQNKDIDRTFKEGSKTFINGCVNKDSGVVLDGADVMRHTTAVVHHYLEAAPITADIHSTVISDAEFIEGNVDMDELLSIIENSERRQSA